MYRNTISFYVLILCPAALPNSLMSTVFRCIIKIFCVQLSCHLQTVTVLLLSQFVFLLFLFLLITVARTSKTMWNNSGESVRLVLFQNLEEMVSFFTIENDVCCGFVAYGVYYVEVCCCSATKSCPTLYDPMDCSMLMSIESVMLSTSHALLPSFSFVFNLSQHQSFPVSRLLMSGGQNIGVLASVLAMNIQG